MQWTERDRTFGLARVLAKSLKSRREGARSQPLPRNLYEWLEEIKNRPLMYLPAADFSNLKSFILGYESALMSQHLRDAAEPPFHLFSAFVARKLSDASTEAETELSSPSWASMIHKAAGTDNEAFTLFFQLLDEFQAR